MRLQRIETLIFFTDTICVQHFIYLFTVCLFVSVKWSDLQRSSFHTEISRLKFQVQILIHQSEKVHKFLLKIYWVDLLWVLNIHEYMSITFCSNEKVHRRDKFMIYRIFYFNSRQNVLNNIISPHKNIAIEYNRVTRQRDIIDICVKDRNV